VSAVPKFEEANLRVVCNILGATDTGLTGTEIGRRLHDCGIADPMPDMTKRHRLYAALAQKQSADSRGKRLLPCGPSLVGRVRSDLSVNLVCTSTAVQISARTRKLDGLSR